MITAGIANLRALISDLRPAALDELGAGPAIEALVERVRAQTGLDIALEVDLAYEQGRAMHRHAPELETTIYRLVQEALTNITKHAAAANVTLRITDPEADPGHVLVEICDDGVGFDPEQPAGGFGLVGMRERIALVDGELAITSAPGEGTRLVARIPIPRGREDAAAPPEPDPQLLGP